MPRPPLHSPSCSPRRRPDGGPVELTRTELTRRALVDPTGSLVDVPVRLRGFVVHDPAHHDRYALTRFAIVCCAADAFPIQVVAPAAGAPSVRDGDIAVVITEQREVTAPDNPYE